MSRGMFAVRSCRIVSRGMFVVSRCRIVSRGMFGVSRCSVVSRGMFGVSRYGVVSRGMFGVSRCRVVSRESQCKYLIDILTMYSVVEISNKFNNSKEWWRFIIYELVQS